jgi:hypothetical protein
LGERGGAGSRFVLPVGTVSDMHFLNGWHYQLRITDTSETAYVMGIECDINFINSRNMPIYERSDSLRVLIGSSDGQAAPGMKINLGINDQENIFLWL